MLVLTLTVGYLILLTAQVRTGGRTVLSNLALTALGPFISAFDSASRLTREGFRAYVWQRDAVLHSEQLAAENRALQGQLEISRTLEKEVLQLRELLKAPKPDRVDFVGARVLTQFGAPFGRLLLVSCSSAYEIPDGTVVLGPQGAVGRIQGKLGSLYKVLLVTDPSSAVGVVSERGGVHGVAVGEGRFLTVRWVTNEADVQAGDLFVTSGEDGFYPPGVRVGTAASVADGGDYLKKITLSPFSKMDELTWVLLLKKSHA
jgi:rod shape-determining protein MreC